MINNTKNNNKIIAPKSWNNLSTHYLKVWDDPWYECIMNLQHYITCVTNEFYTLRNMKTLHLPITTGTISSPMGLGSDSSPVNIEMFGVETYLADSMQFMLEYGCRIFNEGCYYIMPSFRGEQADERHLCQFYHSEAEIVGTLEDVMNLVENYVVFLSKRLLELCGGWIKGVVNDTDHIEKLICSKNKIPRIKMNDAIILLKDICSNKDDLAYYIHSAGFPVITSYGEKKLIEHFGGFVWLTHFDHLSLPFYQAFNGKDTKIARNADLLFGIGETVGCGERHYHFGDVVKALEMHKVDRKEYEWYCKMKELKPMQTSGFGMGIERYLLWILKENDIRDCQVLPRFNGINILP